MSERPHPPTPSTETVKPKRQTDNEGNKYDKIVKENLEKSVPAFINKVLKIKVDRMENLPQVRLQTTKEVEPDSLRLFYNGDHPTGALLNLEFEAKDEKGTDSKMLENVAIAHHKYKLPVVLEMIYLRRGRPKNITGKVAFGGLSFRYRIHCMDGISYTEFISSNEPEEVILAVLADPGDLAPADIIRMILQRLLALRGKGPGLWKFINQLKIFSMLRNLRHETQKQVNDMIIQEDIVQQIQEDELYQLGEKQGLEKGIEQGLEQGLEKGLEQGLEKGLEQGLEKGLEKGKTQKAVTAIVKLAATGFDVNMTAEVLAVEPHFVANILEQYKKKGQIEALLIGRSPDLDKIAQGLGVHPILVELIKDNIV